MACEQNEKKASENQVAVFQYLMGSRWVEGTGTEVMCQRVGIGRRQLRSLSGNCLGAGMGHMQKEVVLRAVGLITSKGNTGMGILLRLGVGTLSFICFHVNHQEERTLYRLQHEGSVTRGLHLHVGLQHAAA